MKWTLLFILPLALLGCGEDISSNRKGASNRTTQGLGEGANQLLASQIHRVKGSTILTYLEEIENTIAGRLAPAYHARPQLADDEGGTGVSVNTVSVLGRPSVACGLETTAGIDARIVDCERKNGPLATWSGFIHGNAGQGTWRLVAIGSDGKELWLDVRTSMVWSSVISTANWCNASGNSEEECATIGGDALCQNTSIPGLGDIVLWRLPTRNDFLQADINGLRAVLKRSGTTVSWTATMRSSSEQTQAWSYDFAEGTLLADNLAAEKQVHCIGAPVR